MTVNVVNLRAEHRVDAFGIGTTRPRLSWIVEGDDTSFEQQAYEVTARRPGRRCRNRPAVSTRTIPCSSRGRSTRWRRGQRRQVRVRVAGADGAFTEWSEPLDIEVGLLDPADWSAVPVTATFDDALARAADQIPPIARRPPRSDAGQVVRLGAGRLHHRLQRVDASATTYWPLAGRRTGIACATRRSTSPTPCDLATTCSG